VHFTVFSTEHDFTAGSAQRAWIAADLRAVDRRVTPWLIVRTRSLSVVGVLDLTRLLLVCLFLS
jgi:hypothetical protein